MSQDGAFDRDMPRSLVTTRERRGRARYGGCSWFRRMSTCAARSTRTEDDTVFADARTTAELLERLQTRELVIRSARRGERLRTHKRGTAWLALVGGRWSIVDAFERDGRRYFLACRNETLAVESLALTPREHVVAHMVAMGRPNKLIAYSIGLATSTISYHLATAMKKVGVVSRLELVTLLTALRPTGVQSCVVAPPLPSQASNSSEPLVDVYEQEINSTSYFVISVAAGPRLADALSPAEREVAQDVLAGLANVEIASKRERSARTIANQLASIFRKLGVGSRFELTARLTSTVPLR